MIAEKQIGGGESRVSYGSNEKPLYSALARAIDALYADLQRPVAELQEGVWEALSLPVEKAEGEGRFLLTTRLWRGVSRLIGRFLDEIAGPDRSREGFVEGGPESETPDGILQQRAVFNYAVGLQRAGDLLNMKPTLLPARGDPAVMEMLDGAFSRLSVGGALRLESVRDDIHSILVSGADAGLSPLDIGRQLSKQLDQYKGWEFQRLARTEAAFAAEAGNREQLKAFGVRFVRWLFSANACPLCLAYEGKLIEIEDIANQPPRHPNCLCSTSPVG